MTDIPLKVHQPGIAASQKYTAAEQHALDEHNARKRMARNLTLAVLFLTLPIIAILWQGAVWTGILNVQISSSPVAVAIALWKYLTGPVIYVHIFATLTATFGGLFLGSVLGLGAGVVFAKSPILERALRPYVALFNALPRPALAPIFLVWFGIGAGAKMATAASIVFFVVYLGTIAGIRSVDPDISNLADSLAMGKWERFKKVEVPSALPHIVTALRLSAVYSVLGVMVAEMVASVSGLGQELVRATNAVAMDRAFAVIILAALVAVGLDMLISIVERRIRGIE